MNRLRRSRPPPHPVTQPPNESPPTPNLEPCFPLYRLPAELRIQIYEHAFTFDSVRCQDGRWRVYEPNGKCFRLATRLGPTLVCKQMRAETIHLLMKLNEMVCGNERRDVDLYREYRMGPRLLKDPFIWAARAVDQGKSVFVSRKSVFRVHVWVFPPTLRAMRNRDWQEVVKSFAWLVDGSFQGRLAVTLHFAVHYQPLLCEYRQPRTSASLQYEYGAFEIGLDGDGLGHMGLVKLFDERREVLRAHRNHERGMCQVRTSHHRLWEDLGWTEQMALSVVQMAHLVKSGHL
jgi:hypothetical protein